MLSSIGKVGEIHVVNPEEEKKRLRWEEFAEKEGWSERVVDDESG